MGSSKSVPRNTPSRSGAKRVPKSEEMGSEDRHIDKRKAIIVCGFTAIGKTYLSNRNAEQGRGTDGDVIDLDSSIYSKELDFPDNYLNAIRQAAETPCVILISTHYGLATQLAKEGYYIVHVYPEGDPDSKKLWLERLEMREKEGRSSRLYKLTDEKWDLWFGRTEPGKRWNLQTHEYLSDIIRGIRDEFETSKREPRE